MPIQVEIPGLILVGKPRIEGNSLSLLNWYVRHDAASEKIVNFDILSSAESKWVTQYKLRKSGPNLKVLSNEN
jgi:hypothetical protein